MSTDDNERQREYEISKAVRKEIENLPVDRVRDPTLLDLERMAQGLKPLQTVKPLQSAGNGVMEMVFNGSPAYRVVYTLKREGKVTVLAARPKTCNGQDKTLIEVARRRLKALK